jgi:hypothetical protein
MTEIALPENKAIARIKEGELVIKDHLHSTLKILIDAKEILSCTLWEPMASSKVRQS